MSCTPGLNSITVWLTFLSSMGGFVRYGTVRNDWVMVKGSVPGVKKRVMTLRKVRCIEMLFFDLVLIVK